jgi:transposase
MIVIGTDTHKASHTAAAVDGATGQVLADRTVRARRRSFEDLLRWECGCGVLIAAKLIGEIAGINRFKTDAKVARIAGSAPIPASTGSLIRHRPDRGGNRQINCALHRLALTKSFHDPDTADYLTRKQAEGKTRREALRCLKRHLARRVWHPRPARATHHPNDPLQHTLQQLLLDIGATRGFGCGAE